MARVVAELGRPETAAETAARKAESSRIYRGSQNARNLVAALIATIAVVAIIIMIVPRGELSAPSTINVAETAALLERDAKQPIIVPEVPSTWRVNKAALDGGAPATWDITYAPGDGLGFLRVSQGLKADPGWATRTLPGSALGETVVLEGITWQTYTFRDSSKSGNVSFALGTQAGADHLLVFGSSPEALITETATKLAPQVTKLEEAAE